MRRMPSSAQRIQTRRARPVIEGLEDRRLLSHAAARQSSQPSPLSAAASFRTMVRKFSYTTPSGGLATIQVVGLGNLAGTTVIKTVISIWSLAAPTPTRRSSAKSRGERPRAIGQHLERPADRGRTTKQLERRRRQRAQSGLSQELRSDRGRKHQPDLGREHA